MSNLTFIIAQLALRSCLLLNTIIGKVKTRSMQPNLILLLLMLLLTSIAVTADEHEVENEIGEGLGNAAVWLLVIGASYVVLRQAFVWSRKLQGDQFDGVKDIALLAYRKGRKPTLYVHNIIMLSAVVVGSVHGVVMWEGPDFTEIFGILTLLVMVFLSIFGLVLFFRWKPLWTDKTIRKYIRLLHRQWIFSVLLIVFLIIHTAS